MKKRAVSLLLVFFLVISVLPLSAFAEDSILLYEVGNKQYLGLNRQTNELVNATEQLPDNLVIPGEIEGYKVTSVSDRLFINRETLKSVSFSTNIIRIGNSAFHGCTALKDVYYAGSEEEWATVTIGSQNEPIQNATILFSQGAPTASSTPEPEEESDPIPDPEPSPDPEPEKPSQPINFTDVSAGAYYAEAVQWAIENGITSGTGNGKFSPNMGCTRAQAVTFLWRAAGSPIVSGGTGFSDVSAGAYYANAVKWAVQNGITSGTGNGKFSPDAVCTRAQIVTFQYRAAGQPNVAIGNYFADVPSTQYFAKAVIWAVLNGVTGGTGGRYFSPNMTCTRGQIVTFLYREEFPIDVSLPAIKDSTEIWEELITSGNYKQYVKVTSDYEQAFGGATRYTIMDIDGDSWNELVLSTDSDSLGFALFSILACDRDTGAISVVGITDMEDGSYGTWGQYCRNISYSAKYHALVYQSLNNGMMYGSYGFRTINDGKLSREFTVSFSAEANGKRSCSLTKNGKRVTISESDFETYMNEPVSLSFKKLPLSSLSSKIDLKGYLGTSLYDFVDMMGNMKNGGATSGIEYVNNALVVSSEGYPDDSICFIEIRNACDFSIYGIEYGMDYNDAVQIARLTSEYSYLSGTQRYTMSDGSYISIWENNGKVSAVALFAKR